MEVGPFKEPTRKRTEEPGASRLAFVSALSSGVADGVEAVSAVDSTVVAASV